MLCLLILGGLLYWILKPDTSKSFDIDTLEAYIDGETVNPSLKSEISVYIDFSDGMNSAFASSDSQNILKALMNKLSGKELDAEFYSLANNKISQIDASKTTGLYNYILNPQNYNNHSAPIEHTLNDILNKKCHALLITDFEEYNDGRIQQAAYAKDAFTQWIEEGNNIIFYMWQFTEGTKTKKLFLTVFDDQSNALNSLVIEAINQENTSNVETFVVGGKDFAYPLIADYLSVSQGGNYHNENGVDIITKVNESGNKDSFKNFCLPIAGDKGHSQPYDRLNNSYGKMAQFYPFGATWENIVLNYNGVKAKHPDIHLLGNLFVNFNAQNGFDIEAVEARVFDVQSIFDSVPQPIMPQVFDMFRAEKYPVDGMVNNSRGWEELTVDLDEKFTGTNFSNGFSPDDLFRINIVIADASVRVSAVNDFFQWEGNNSLAASIVNTLQSSGVNPKGRVLMSYFVKIM